MVLRGVAGVTTLDSTTGNVDTDDGLCRRCGTVLPPTGLCPYCVSMSNSGDVRIRDILLSVLMAVVALFATIPATALLISQMIIPPIPLSDQMTATIAISVWNGFILGTPIGLLTLVWKERVRSHVSGYHWVWHDYWVFQMVALLPVWFVLLYVVFSILGAVFSILF
jgi:hypothetical protein